MSDIDKLLQGQEVQWKTLGEVAKLEKGRQLNKKDLSDKGLYPAYNGGTSFSGFTDLYNYSANKIIISQGGASAGFVNYVTTDFYANAHCYVVLPDETQIVNRYLYHFLKLNQTLLMGRQHGAGIPALNASEILELSIPIAPLSVQEKIVEILDKFTTLEAELEAELDCRKRQYEYYRNQLLSLDVIKRQQGINNVTWLTLGEVFETRNGYTPSKANAAFWENGTIPWFRMEDIRANGGVLKDSIQHVTPQAIKGKGLFMAGSIIMATTATIGEHALITVDALANQQFTNFRVRNSMEDKLLTKFVYYYFFIIDEWCRQNVNVSSFPSVEIERLKKQPFPIPPLAEQQRIVSILDKFEALTTSISEGLPKEIELRRKQYEYYCNQLLSFA